LARTHRQRRLAVLRIFALAALVGCSWFEEERPNIVLVIGDDHGYPYAGFMGDPIVKTPHLDALAAGGVVFPTTYVTASTCEPSLRTLLTGGEPFPRTAAPTAPTASSWGEMHPEDTLPGILGRAGYASYQVGKLWQDGYRRAGFTEGSKGENLTGGSFEKMMGGRAGLEIGRTTMQPIYDFIDRHREEPFFLFFAPNVPHRPWNAPPEQRAKYAGFAKQITPSALAYYANISWFDDSLGKLVDHLDRKGLRSRTLIVYLSDNGFRQDPHDTFDPKRFDHGKDSMGEIGFRTPLIFNWPGRIPAGVVRDDLVSSLDLFPTLLDYAGVTVPPGRVGIDLRSAIEEGTQVPRSALIGAVQRVRPVSLDRSPGSQSKLAYFVRTPKWHYLQYPFEKREQLFDIASDPREQRDVAGANPKVIAEQRQRLEAWKAEMPQSGG
jgi:arylsulfatase A